MPFIMFIGLYTTTIGFESRSKEYVSPSDLHYSGPCDLRPPIQPVKYGLKLNVVLK